MLHVLQKTIHVLLTIHEVTLTDFFPAENKYYFLSLTWNAKYYNRGLRTGTDCSQRTELICFPSGSIFHIH